MKLLDSLSFPKDLKKLNNKQCEDLCAEIREFLIDSVSKTGGHLASNLGVVELTMSLFRTFDFNKDKIVWDVGHQSYIYKILTGRKDGFKNLRQYKGMSGFPKTEESKFDFFNTGHSSTSISAALGMARARDIKNENYHVTAVIGDGALTGGMALEALNDVGYKKTKMIIILNDNQMSISKNVGGLSKYLNNIRMAPQYNKLKNEINASLEHSQIGKNIAGKISKVKDSIKQLVVPSMLFENMGIKYIGPIDGHDIKELTYVLNRAKDIEEPVIIHVITQKGKGYAQAEESPMKYHSIGPFICKSGKLKNRSCKNSYSKAFGCALAKVSENDYKVVGITAAMPEGTGLSEYAKEFKSRFFDVGIAEEHAVTMAAGMAAGGLKPVVALYSTFLQRAYDQIIHDVCLQNLPVVFAIDRAGIVGEDGETHQGIMDVSFLNTIPNMTIVQPKCLEEVEVYLKYALNAEKPVALRYPKGADEVSLEPIKEVKENQWEVIKQGKKICVIASGKMLQHAYIASEILYEKGVAVQIVNANFIKPLDKKMLQSIAENKYNILTVEDNMLSGGLGSAVKDYLYSIEYKGKINCLGYNSYVHQGSVSKLYKEFGLDPESIADKILELYD